MTGSDRARPGGRLYVCATPIGNLEDVSLRLLRVLGEVSLIAAEDTRRTARLCARYEISTPLVSCHEHNERERAREIVVRLGRGESVAFVSDAGTPAVADPGAHLTAQARAAGYDVRSVPGPSAVTASLAVSGFAADAFVALGFLPRRGARRRRALERIASEALPVVLFEAPGRVVATLRDLGRFLGGRPVWVGRELTKEFESAYAGSAEEVADRVAADPRRGEYTVVIGPERRPQPAGDAKAADLPLRREVALLVGAGLSEKEAMRRVARAHDLPRQAVYRTVKGGPEA